VTRVLLAALLGLLTVLGTPDRSAAAAEGGLTSSVVLVGAPGLAWSDLDPATTPHLLELAGDGAVGSMTVRGDRSVACGVDGWLILGAGRRASGPGCEPARPVTDGTVPGWGADVAAVRAQSYGAVPGTLAARLAASGECVETVGPGAAVAGADPEGRVAHHLDDVPSAPSCAVVLVDAGTLPAPGESRAAALAALDALVGEIAAGLSPGNRLVVAGVGDGESPVAPRAVLVSGPPSGTLTSPSTRQVGLIQLQDLTATLLASAGAEDGGLTGRPVSVVPDAAGAVGARGEAGQGFERRAVTMRAISPQVTGWLAASFGAWSLLTALWWWRRRAVPRGLVGLGVVVGVVPVGTFLANLVPWWRVDAPSAAFLVALGAAVALTSTAALAMGRRLPLGALRTVAAVTLLVLGGDVLTGSTVQLASVFGQNPTVGGRFYGLGNTSFALFGLAVLVLVQWVGDCARLGRWRVPLAVALLLATLGLEAHPSFGADFGGPPGLLLGGLVVLAAVAGVRLTPWRVLGGLVVAGLLTVGVAVADWLRPPENRTHLGDFVQSVIDGGGGDVITRKLAQNLENLGSAPLLAVTATVTVLAVTLARAGWRPGRAGTVVCRGALVMAVVGFAVNDSGLVIPAFVAVVLAPLLLADRTCPRGPWPGVARRGR
jgi:hypothetical protein